MSNVLAGHPRPYGSNIDWMTGATGINYAINSNHRIPDNLMMYSAENKEKIVHRFYKTLYSFFDDEEKSKSEINRIFNIQFMLSSNPEDILAEGEFYRQAIGLFYINKRNTDPIWLRDGSAILQVEKDKLSGSIYFSPFFEDRGIIYLGKCKIVVKEMMAPNFVHKESLIYIFLSEGQKEILFLKPQQFNSLQIIHVFEWGLLRTLNYKPKINGKENLLGDLVLSGKLSDEKIQCLDGIVNVSRSLLSISSDYFCYLFVNTNFSAQKEFKLEYPKMFLENYVYYSSGQHSSIKISPEIIWETIQFASFIQDKNYMAYLYNVMNDDLFEIFKDDKNKIHLQLMKLYTTFGFKFEF
jgi:hypothetical protein